MSTKGDSDLLNIVEDYDKAPNEKLLIKILEETGKTKCSIAHANFWMDTLLPEKLKLFSFYLQSGEFIRFTGMEINKPMRKSTESGDDENIPMMPNWCRDHNQTYEGTVYFKYNVEIGGKIKNQKKVYVGKIPIMLGSNKCHLYNMTREELIKAGECPTDPFSYYIIRSERIIIIQEKARPSIPIIYANEKTGLPTLRITTPKPKSGTKVISMTIGKNTSKIKIGFESTSKKGEKNRKHIPIYTLFRFLGVEFREATDMILNYIPEYLKEPTIQLLEESKSCAGVIQDTLKYICRKTNTIYIGKEEILIREELTARILDDLFCDIYNKDDFDPLRGLRRDEESKKMQENIFNHKIQQLSYMTARLCLAILGVYPFDNRDSWMVKSFNMPGIRLGELICKFIYTTIEDIKKKEPELTTFDNLLSKSMKNNFMQLPTCFNKAMGWGVIKGKGNMKGENPVESYTRDTAMKTNALISKTTSNSNSKNKVMEQRRINGTQDHLSDIVQTPESEAVGLIKYMAITAWSSVGTDPQSIIDLILQERIFHNRKSKKEEYLDEDEYIIHVNGKLIYDTRPETKDNDRICKVNGKKFYKLFMKKRRNGEIHYEVDIFVDAIMQEIRIHTDSSRLMAPYLIVNKKTEELVIDEKNAWDWSFQDLLKNGCIEYVSAAEREMTNSMTNNIANFVYCESVTEFYNTRKENEITKEELNNSGGFVKSRKTYSHVVIHGMQLLSPCSSTCRAANFQQGARNIFQSSMTQQAMTNFHTNYARRFDTSFKRIIGAQRGLTETLTFEMCSLDKSPPGRIMTVAFYDDKDNQEDAVCGTDSSQVKYDKYVCVEFTEPASETGYIDRYGKPQLKPHDKKTKYDGIGDDGMPILGKQILDGDCLVGVIRTDIQGNTTTSKSLFADKSQQGYIMRVHKRRIGGTLIITIKLKKRRDYEPGDKGAFGYSQKGTWGTLLDNYSTLTVVGGKNDGMVADLLYNPHGLPTRMTIGMVYEGILTAVAILTGKRFNMSPFTDLETLVKYCQKILREHGMDEYCEETVSRYGKVLPNKIYMVPLFYQLLKHHVADKYQARGRGERDIRKNQPMGGVNKGRAQKKGEQEEAALVVHGCAYIIRECMLLLSDRFDLIICTKCGIIPKNNPLSKKAYCDECESSDHIGIVTLSYAFKILFQTLQLAYVDIRLITTPIEK